MRLTIEKNTLLKALSHVTSVVERRNTIPILSNVVLDADALGLKLRATDLDIEVTESVECETAIPGATTVSAHTLHDIVRRLDGKKPVELELKDGMLHLKCAASKFRLACLPPDDLPELTASGISHTFELQPDELRRLLEKTRFAISTEETRYYLNGIFFHVVETPLGHRLRAVATDGHRLALVQLEPPASALGCPGVILPRKMVGELLKLLADAAAPVKVEVSNSKVRFSVGSVVLLSKLIDGTFPDYQRVIPQSNEITVTVDRAEFVAATDRVATLSSEKSKAVKFDARQDSMLISVNDADNGTATDEIHAEINGKPVVIGFNARYILDIASQLEGDRMQFMLGGSDSPAIIKEGDDALYVQMPMRV